VFSGDERRALVFLSVVAAVGAGFRLAGGTGPAAATAAAVAPQLAGGDLVRQAAASQHAQALQRPLGPLERVDVDRAAARELERLPRVGPALARRIVAERDAHGPFGSLQGLRRVGGIGPKMLAGLEPHVTFGGVVPVTAAQALTAPVAAAAPAGRPGSAWVELSAPAPATGAKSGGCARPPDLNHAGVAELTCLPGVGPLLAERLVAERTAHGPFHGLADLARVKGFGAARIRRLKDLVTIP